MRVVKRTASTDRRRPHSTRVQWISRLGAGRRNHDARGLEDPACVRLPGRERHIGDFGAIPGRRPAECDRVQDHLGRVAWLGLDGSGGGRCRVRRRGRRRGRRADAGMGLQRARRRPPAHGPHGRAGPSSVEGRPDGAGRPAAVPLGRRPGLPGPSGMAGPRRTKPVPIGSQPLWWVVRAYPSPRHFPTRRRVAARRSWAAGYTSLSIARFRRQLKDPHPHGTWHQ